MLSNLILLRYYYANIKIHMSIFYMHMYVHTWIEILFQYSTYLNHLHYSLYGWIYECMCLFFETKACPLDLVLELSSNQTVVKSKILRLENENGCKLWKRCVWISITVFLVKNCPKGWCKKCTWHPMSQNFQYHVHFQNKCIMSEKIIITLAIKKCIRISYIY